MQQDITTPIHCSMWYEAPVAVPALIAVEPKAKGHLWLSICITFLHSTEQNPPGELRQEQPLLPRLDNMYTGPLWMIMTQSGFDAESCVFRIRRSMLLRNQADTEQMLNWSLSLGREEFPSQRCSSPEQPNYLQLVGVSMLDIQQINPAPFVKIERLC